jgi:hypothetical protein
MPFTPTGTWYDEPKPKSSSSSGVVPGGYAYTTGGGPGIAQSPLQANVRSAWEQAGGNRNYTAQGYIGFSKEMTPYLSGEYGSQQQPGAPGGPGGDSGGGGYGYGGGGGGGGGGAPAMTQGQWDMMLRVLGTKPPDLDLQTLNLPTFRGVPIRRFQGQLYNRMQNRLRRGVQADKATVNRQMGNLRSQLKSSYRNPYAAAAYATNPVMRGEMQALMQGTGANPLDNPYIEAVNAENAYAENSDAAFGSLMNVLAAANREEQSSRLSEVGMNRVEALNRINADRLALGTGIDLAKGKAKEAWQIRADDRRYQNSLTRQQWNREERMRNQDTRNLERSTEYKTDVDTQNTRIQALLDMLGAATGSPIDFGGIERLIKGWGGTTTPGAPKKGEGSEYLPKKAARRRRYKAKHSGNAGGG